MTAEIEASQRHTSMSWWSLILWLLPCVVLPLYYEHQAWRMAGVLGFPLDDAWIHAQFARNLATARGFTYTGSQWVAGSTSPAWTILLAVGYLLTHNAVVAAKILGICLQLTSGVIAVRLASLLGARRSFAVAAGLLVAIAPVSVWGAVSGMEVGLASVLVLGGCYLHLQGGTRARSTAALVLLATACLARPETFVVFALVAVRSVLARRHNPREAVAAALTAAAVALLVLGPFVLFDYLTIGKPLPTTFYAKSGPGLVRAISDHNAPLVRTLLFKHGPDAVRKFVATVAEQFGVVSWVLLAGLVAGVLAPRSRRGTLFIVAVVALAAYSMGLVAPQRLKPENVRYTAQFVALIAVAGFAGLSSVRLMKGRTVRLSVIAVLLGLTGWQAVRSATVYAWSVTNIQQLHVTLGNWISVHVPPGARIAVNDIGALAYFGRHEVVDLEGLVSPAALAYPRPTRGLDFVAATRPDYIAVFPTWYPDFSKRPQLFPEVYRVSIAHNVVSAGDTLVVYRTPWTRYPTVR